MATASSAIAIRSSPFFNIFANINVRLFSMTEAQQLISQLLTGTGINFTETEIDSLFYIAGYHPYFLQVAGHFLFEAYRKGLNQEERTAFMNKGFRREAVAHFDDYWRNSFEQEKIVLTALALLKRQQRKVNGRAFSLGQLQELYTRSDQTLEHLEKRGLLISQGNLYSLFSTLFAEWICSEITDTLHDPQTYEDWLKSNKRAMEQLSVIAKGDLSAVLPKIGAQYRELIIKWVSDPRNLIAVAGLLKTVLGFA